MIKDLGESRGFFYLKNSTNTSNSKVQFVINKIDKKYLFWILGVITWNYGFPIVPPLYDVVMAILLKHLLS